MIVSPAHTPNWDMVADVVNSVSRVYRSPKQCRHRYETVIIPREEGRILYDMNPRKQKKTKGIYKVTVSVGTIHRFTLFLPSLTCVVLSLICLCNLVAYVGLDKQTFECKIVNIFLLISLTCFRCSKEPSHRDGSFEYPQHMFWLRNKYFLVRTIN